MWALGEEMPLRTWEPGQFPGGQVGPKEEALLLALGQPRWDVSRLESYGALDIRPEVTWQLWPLQCTSVSWEEFWESGRQHLEAVKLK